MSNVQTLLNGLAFPESPRWHEGRLWLCDWIAQEVIAVDLKGQREVVTNVRSMPFCIDFLPDGRLLFVEDQRLVRIERDGSLTTHADLSGLSSHAWNEIVVDGHGNAYVNNIGFDYSSGEFAPGIIALVTPDGTARQVADGVAFPNGMALTPEKTLIVAESYGKKLSAFDIAANGDLVNRRVWADLGDASPDGICLDAQNAIWYADVPNKCCVRVREGGEVLQTINLDRGCFSCTLGGDNGTSLFMVVMEWNPESMDDARTGSVLSAEVPVPGASWSRA
jgi:sugar lactone lactonase YvrE